MGLLGALVKKRGNVYLSMWVETRRARERELLFDQFVACMNSLAQGGRDNNEDIVSSAVLAFDAGNAWQGQVILASVEAALAELHIFGYYSVYDNWRSLLSTTDKKRIGSLRPGELAVVPGICSRGGVQHNPYYRVAASALLISDPSELQKFVEGRSCGFFDTRKGFVVSV